MALVEYTEPSFLIFPNDHIYEINITKKASTKAIDDVY